MIIQWKSALFMAATYQYVLLQNSFSYSHLSNVLGYRHANSMGAAASAAAAHHLHPSLIRRRGYIGLLTGNQLVTFVYVSLAFRTDKLLYTRWKGRSHCYPKYDWITQGNGLRGARKEGRKEGRRKEERKEERKKKRKK